MNTKCPNWIQEYGDFGRCSIHANGPCYNFWGCPENPNHDHQMVIYQ